MKKPLVRIGGGRLRGRGIAVPEGVRPTSARVRESLMDLWASRIPGVRVLDLFGGSGAVGIEAISRGAASVLIVDAEPKVLRHLMDVTRSLDLREVRVLKGDLPGDLGKRVGTYRGPFDLIFADPPYGFEAYAPLLEESAVHLAPLGEICVEHDSRQALPGKVPGLIRSDERKYGDSTLSFYRLAGEAQG